MNELSRRQLELINDFCNNVYDCYSCENASPTCGESCHGKEKFKLRQHIKKRINDGIYDYIKREKENSDPRLLLEYLFEEEHCSICEHNQICEEMEDDCNFVHRKLFINILNKIIKEESYRIESERI